jgi:hypothetical protein
MCFFLHEVARYDLKPFVGSILPYRRFAGKLMFSRRSAGVDVQIVDDTGGVVETGTPRCQQCDRGQSSASRKALSVSLTTRRLSSIIVRAWSHMLDRLCAFQQFGHIATPHV